MKRVMIFGVPTDAGRFNDAITMLSTWATEREARRYVCTCPVYTLMVCRERPDVHNAVSNASMITADGMPVVWQQRRQGVVDAERVYGPDVMLALCDATAARDVRHYFWGGAPGIPERLAETLRARNPTLTIAGAYSPPHSDVPDTPDVAVAERLNAARPDVIWVGLGSPKQDLWMARYRPVLDAPLLIGVGAAFDFISGAKAQAPGWMQRTGVEWLFRLMQEPRRLGKRYLVYNPKYIWLALSYRRGA